MVGSQGLCIYQGINQLVDSRLEQIGSRCWKCGQLVTEDAPLIVVLFPVSSCSDEVKSFASGQPSATMLSYTRGLKHHIQLITDRQKTHPNHEPAITEASKTMNQEKRFLLEIVSLRCLSQQQNYKWHRWSNLKNDVKIPRRTLDTVI